MNHSVKARLTWLTAGKGGRSTPPAGPRYSTVTHFSAQGTDWKKDAWSLVVEFTQPPDASLSHPVQVTFLIPDGPAHLLTSGNSFELLEGDRVVAEGVIL